jgi:hypothetical protein
MPFSHLLLIKPETPCDEILEGFGGKPAKDRRPGRHLAARQTPQTSPKSLVSVKTPSTENLWQVL